MKMALNSVFWLLLRALAASALLIGSHQVFAAQVGIKTLNLKPGEGLKLETLVVYPERAQTEALPVLIMEHGFMLSHLDYQDILSQIAIEGFVILAPQNYAAGGVPFGQPSTDNEAKISAAAVKWFEPRLADLIGQPVDFSKIGIINHSRGGKVSWTMLRDKLIKAQAIAAIDPVDLPLDGSARVTGGEFQVTIPSLLIGTGLGSLGTLPCAPSSMGFPEFWKTVHQSPSWLFVAKDFGHMDFMDEGMKCGLNCQLCAKAASDKSKLNLRAWIASTVALFMRGILYDEPESLAKIGTHSADIELTEETR